MHDNKTWKCLEFPGTEAKVHKQPGLLHVLVENFYIREIKHNVGLNIDESRMIRSSQSLQFKEIWHDINIILRLNGEKRKKTYTTTTSTMTTTTTTTTDSNSKFLYIFLLY